MGGNKRQRELARLKYQRRQERRAKQHRRTRIQARVAMATLGVVAVVAGALFVGSLFGDDNGDAAANQDTSQPPGQCDYRAVDRTEREVKSVGTPPPQAHRDHRTNDSSGLVRPAWTRIGFDHLAPDAICRTSRGKSLR